MDVETLVPKLEADGLNASFHPADDDVDMDRALLGVLVEGADDPVWVQISKAPGEDLDGAELFQLFAPVAVDPPADALPELHRFLAEINGDLPLGTFAHDPASGAVYFRHVAVSDVSDPTGNVLVQTTWLATFALHMLAREVAAVAAGDLTAAEAVAALEGGG